ncbi:hypothetical protein ACFL0Q_06850 [Thermodesulfobacteriota bacterium]
MNDKKQRVSFELFASQVIHLDGVAQFLIEKRDHSTATEILRDCSADGWLYKHEEEQARL